jgi:protein-disulfide isomerase
MKKFALLAVAATLLSACGGEGEGNQTAAVNMAGPVGTPVAAPNGGDWTQTVTQTPEGGIMLGNPNAAVKLVEFGSMTCPHCAEFSETATPQLIDKYVKTGQVAFEFRNFVRDPLDITMSLIARCGGASPQFFRLTEAMYADQTAIFERFQAAPPAQLQAAQALPPAQQFPKFAEYAGLQSWAAQRGLPSGRSSQCLTNQAEIERLVQMNSDAATQYNIPGTPAFVINGELVENAADWATLEPKIREALGG